MNDDDSYFGEHIVVEVEDIGAFVFRVPTEMFAGQVKCLSEMIFPDEACENIASVRLVVIMATSFTFLMIQAPDSFDEDELDPMRNLEDFQFYFKIFDAFLAHVEAYAEMEDIPDPALAFKKHTLKQNRLVSFCLK